ncbi:MAG: hypothetical protein GX558_10255 [Clostridiales bacterium]|nr:hypothetical protein [Clostridiales bacterium]
MPDAIGIGAAVWDTLIELARYPDEDGKLQADAIAHSGGGPTATALVAMARLGLRAAFMGNVGDDEAGDRVIRDFVRYGVSTEFLGRRAGCATSVAYILVNRGRDTRTIIHRRGNAPPPLCEGQMAALRKCRLLHVEGLHGEAALRAATTVRSAGGLVSLDAGSPHPGIERLMEICHLLVASGEFAKKHTGRADPADALSALRERYRPDVLVVTLGAAGGLWAQAGRSGGYPAFRVPVVDTTGAGDVFHGAFARFMLDGLAADKAARLASAVAALKCTRPGGRAGIPTLAEARAFAETAAEQ